MKLPTPNAVDEWKAFLESTPAKTPKAIPGLLQGSDLEGWRAPLPRLQLHCDVDGGFRGFDCSYDRTPVGFQFLKYQCRDCGNHTKTFAVIIDRRLVKDLIVAKVMKLGEFPPFSAPISARIQRLLGPADLELYRQGTRSEAQGLGIGAASYFRRIVENQWKQLVREIRDAAGRLGVKDLSVFEAALEETQFSTAVRMLKDAIPGKLLILDSQNPLTLLYQPLSVQLHGLSDAQCLQQAQAIRVVLTALLENIADVLRDQYELKSAAERLRQREP